MEMLGITRKAKYMVFQPQYAQCFTATTYLPQTNDYHHQYQNTSTVSNIPNKRTVNIPNKITVYSPPTMSHALSNQSSDFLDLC
jgi:hypothetical protein